MIRDWSKFTKLVVYGGALLALLTIIGSMLFAFGAWSKASAEREAERDRGDTIQAEKNTLQDEYNKLYREYRDATGERPNAPTPGEVKVIAGVRGATGANGQNATDAQVASAVRGYCAMRIDNCIGMAGTNGTNGADGKDGADGAPGAPGKDGADGANGADGRSVTRIVCTGSEVVFYDQYDAEIGRINMVCLP